VIATVETHMRHRLYDANGVEIPLATWADTESGVVVRLVPNESGGVKLNAERTKVLRTVDKYPAPLRLEPVA